MSCGCNGAITNQGARLIDRARNEGKSIVFSGVRMNTVYENDIMSLVQKPKDWYGENVGEVVGCLSHIIIDEVSHVCDAKVAVQCNDNSMAWKSISIYGHLEGESNDTLIYCESIQNGDFKGTTVVELPVTLDGAVEDFGLSEGGGGGGGDVPANMMTTNTEQSGLSGTKTWTWDSYEGEGTVEEPQDGDRKINESVSIDVIEDNHIPLALDRNESQYSSKDGWYAKEGRHLRITSGGVDLNNSFASWTNILKASRVDQGFDHAPIRDRGDGSMEIGGEQVKPNAEIKIGFYAMLVIDSNGDIASVHSSAGSVLDISAAVYDNGSMHSVSGIVSEDAGLSFDSPITPQEGQEVYIHWTHYVD